MIRYALYDPVRKHYNSLFWKTPEAAKVYVEDMCAIYNPNKWEKRSKYYKIYERTNKYYKRLVLKKANIKWEKI